MYKQSMGYDKAEIIALTLEEQANEIVPEIKAAERAGAMSHGARDIMAVFARNISAVMGKAEETIEADESLSSEAKVSALRHVSAALTRVSTASKEMAKNQQNLVLEAHAKATVLTNQAEKFRKKAISVRAQAVRKLELELEEEEKLKAEAKPKPRRRKKASGAKGATT